MTETETSQRAAQSGPRAERVCKACCLPGLCVASTLSVIFAACIILPFPTFFKNVFNREMLLVEGTTAYAEWLEPSVQPHTKYYLFSVQNPVEVAFHGAKPMLEEMGPYVFREQTIKEDVQHIAENATVSYKIKKYFYFEPGESKGTLDDLVTTVNIPVLGAASAAKKGGIFMQWGLSSALESFNSKLFVTRTVRELLFDGYEDPLLTLADMMGAAKDSSVPIDKFGWFYKRNGTTWADGIFNMHTGADDLELMGRIHSWNYATHTHFPSQCGDIKGSAGGFYPPGTASESIELFSHETCRTLNFRSKGNKEIRGLVGTEYKLDETTFANASVHPENECFHNNLPTGVQNSTLCKTKSPAFLSFPHFHLADEYYREQIHPNGTQMTPRAEDHESRIVLEPNTGIPLEVAIRLQINIQLSRHDFLGIMSKLPRELYLPCIWFDAHVQIPQNSSYKLQTAILLPSLISHIGLGIVIGGAFGVLLSIWLRYKRNQLKAQSTRFEEYEEDHSAMLKSHVLKTQFIAAAEAPRASLSSSSSSNCRDEDYESGSSLLY